METATEIKVRYSETDAMGVVYHANYLLYLEVARTEFLEKLGFPYKSMEDAGFMSPVLSCNLQYGQSFGYGDTVVVYTSVSKVTAVKSILSRKASGRAVPPMAAWMTPVPAPL